MVVAGGSAWRCRGAGRVSRPLPLCSPGRYVETVGKPRAQRAEEMVLFYACVCVCVRAHIGARKIISKILKMRHYRSLPIGNRTAVLLYCLFYLPKISVVYCH